MKDYTILEDMYKVQGSMLDAIHAEAELDHFKNKILGTAISDEQMDKLDRLEEAKEKAYKKVHHELKLVTQKVERKI